MATLTEQIRNWSVEVKLPRFFSKMKISIDGREMGVGVKTRKTQVCTILHEGSEIVVTLVDHAMPRGYDFSIALNGTVVVSRMISESGKDLDTRLVGIPKWMFVFPILAGAPIALHGLIPGALGGAGAAIGYKIVASFKDDRRKLFMYGIANIVVTYALVALLVFGISLVLLQFGLLRHNKDYMESTVSKTNEDLPIRIDETTTLVRASNQMDTLTLSYTLDSFDLSDFEFDHEGMKLALAGTSCADRDMKLLLKNGYWVRYEYIATGIPVGSVKISEADCPE